jgi:RNA polymerase sigma-70 factor (ECF subfamily)
MSTASEWIASLLELCSEGDEEALGTLFDFYRRRLRREVARQLVDTPHLAARFDASDVVQEVYLDARRQLSWYLANTDRIDFWPWLRGLARERRLKFLRDHLDAQRRTVKAQHALPDDSWGHPASPDPSPSGAVGKAEEAARMRCALQRLRPEDQEIIRLRVNEARSNPEVAELLGIMPGAVAKRLQRALRRLKEAADYLGGASNG